jgi:large subunit ribosomal protein L25
VTTRPVLTAHHRELSGKAVSRLRHQGILPAVLYGHGHASEAIQVDAKEFEHLRRTAGRNALVDLKVDSGRARPALVYGIQEHPVRRVPIHIDFYLVKMTEEMTVEVPLVAVGVSEAVEKHGGTLLQTLERVRVRALPADLPSVLEFDISHLDSFDVRLHVSDLAVPDGVTVLTDADEDIAHVQPSRAEVAIEAAAAEGAPGEEAPAAEAAESAAEA